MHQVKFHQVTWIDFDDPHNEDITYLQENFSIHPLAIEEFVTPTYQPKVVQYDGCLFLSIHIPLFDTDHRTTFPGELDIILTDGYLITSHKHDIYPLTKFFSELAKNEGRRRLYMSQTPTHLLYAVLDILFNSCFPKLNHIAERLDFVESQVFAEKEKEMVLEISVLKRDILNFRRTLKPQRSILESLLAKDHPHVADDLKPYFQDLIGTNIRIWNILESNKETIEALEATNNSLLSSKLDLTMSVYTNMLAMTAAIPFGNSPNAFWIHTVFMLVIAAVTVVVFKWKRWF